MAKARLIKLPSIKSLIEYNLACDEEDAKAIRDALYVGDTAMANSIMGTSGIECIPWPRNAFNNCQTPTHTLKYFNAGDPYVPTLVSLDGRPWYIACYGDVLESRERKWGKGE